MSLISSSGWSDCAALRRLTPQAPVLQGDRRVRISGGPAPKWDGPRLWLQQETGRGLHPPDWYFFKLLLYLLSH